MYNYLDRYNELVEKKKSHEYDYDLENTSFKGKVCCFSGHRPSKLPFLSESDPGCLALMKTIRDSIGSAIHVGYNNFISGMALGVDQWAALGVIDYKYTNSDIRLYAALPCEDFSKRWKQWQKDQLDDILSYTDDIYVASREYTRYCPNTRNAFMVKNSDFLLAVFDGSAGGTANTVKMAEKKGIDIKIINPMDFR